MNLENIKFERFSLILIVSYVIYALVYIYFGEKVPVNNGFGWDGFIYGNGVRNFPHKLINKEFLDLHVERLLPSAFLYFLFTIMHIEFSDFNIIKGFQFINLTLITGSLLLWCKVAGLARLNGLVAMIGLVALIFSFPVSKFIPYYAVLTDASALLIGFLTLAGFLAGKNLYLIGAFLIACFTWPVAALGIPVLLIFKRDRQFLFAERQNLNTFMFLSGLLLLDAFIYYFFVISNNMSDVYPAFRRMAPAGFSISHLIAGIASLDIFLFLCFGFILKINIFHNIKIFFRSITLLNLVIFVATIAALKMYVGTFPKGEYVKLSWYVIDLFTTQTIQPFSNVICMILFYGPVIFLLIFNWNAVVEKSRMLGVGFMLFFILNLIQCLDAESRHLIFFYPFMLYLATITFNSKITLRFFAVFTIISILFSKIWLQINTPEFVLSILNEKVFSNEIHQRYFMHHGLFMSYKYYIIQFVIVIISGVVMYLLHKKKDQFSANLKTSQNQ